MKKKMCVALLLIVSLMIIAIPVRSSAGTSCLSVLQTGNHNYNAYKYKTGTVYSYGYWKVLYYYYTDFDYHRVIVEERVNKVEWVGQCICGERETYKGDDCERRERIV